MIEESVDVVCTGHGTHSVRELVVLVPVKPRTDLAVMRREAGLPEAEPTADECRGFGVKGTLTTIEGGRCREQHKSEARLVDTPDVGWQVVHRGCPTCRTPLVVPVAHLVLAARPRPADGRLEVDVRPV